MALGKPSIALRMPCHGIRRVICRAMSFVDGARNAICLTLKAIDGIRSAIDGAPEAGE